MTPERFRPLLILRLSSFHIGSAMSDILLATVWNRVMISDLGQPAWTVGLLLAVRYFLSPLSIWAGFRSDTNQWFGLRRTPYIWLGRLLMVLALPLLASAMGRLAVYQDDPIGWLLTVLCFLLFGVGTLLSGSTYLALVRDTVPVQRQGLAVSMVLTVLIIFFPISAVIYSRWMPRYELATFQQMVYGTAAIAGFFWFVAVVGVERRHSLLTSLEKVDSRPQHLEGRFFFILERIWSDSRTRRFLLFFALATLMAWLQDAILEPFGADLFGLIAEQTTDFSRIWLGMTAIMLIGSNLLLRKQPPARQAVIANSGLALMVVGMALLALASFATQLRLVQVGLAVFGAGFGVYSFGGFNLMAIMTTLTEAGAYLGMWTVTELVFKGLGTFAGGALRDVLLRTTNSPSISYGIVFTVEAVGLLAAIFILARVDLKGWIRDTGRPQAGPVEQTPLAVDL